MMGVHRQLVYPSFGLLAIIMQSSLDGVIDFLKIDPEVAKSLDSPVLGEMLIQAHNDWVISSSKILPDRLRPVAILPVGSVESMMSEAERVIEGGGRAFWITSAVPPAGTSPANEKLDPLWAMAAESDVTMSLHIGSEVAFTDRRWRDVPGFDNENDSLEFPGLNAFTLATLPMAAENFLAAMTLGGVFERHPRLRFGIIELGANWVGPLAERMDTYARQFKGPKLTMKPSEYLNRNVRVTPFYFEAVDRFLERYPDLTDVYVYSSDYPHVEGGKEPPRHFHDKLAWLGDEVLEKFFVTNGEWILPA